MSNKEISTEGYEDAYSDSAFWGKVKKYAKKAGVAVLEPALILYYCLKDPDTPSSIKATILGALGYFISPIDFIPDFTPLIGYSDDLGVLVATVTLVAKHIKPEHKAAAKETMQAWFR